MLGNLKTIQLFPIFICIWDMIFQKWENIGKTVLENYRIYPNLGKNWDIALLLREKFGQQNWEFLVLEKVKVTVLKKRLGKLKTNSTFPLSYVLGHYFPNLGFDTAANRLQLFDMKLLLQGYSVLELHLYSTSEKKTRSKKNQTMWC